MLAYVHCLIWLFLSASRPCQQSTGSKLGEAARAFLEEQCRQVPQTPSSAIQGELRECFGLHVSISQINRVRAILGISNHSKLFLEAVGLRRTWNLRNYTGQALALLTGRHRAYSYRHTERFLAELTSIGADVSLTEALARWTASLWELEQPGRESPVPVFYVDGHRKPVYADSLIPRGLIGRTGKILGCRALVVLYDQEGHLLLATTHRGDQHLTIGLPAMLSPSLLELVLYSSLADMVVSFKPIETIGHIEIFYHEELIVWTSISCLPSSVLRARAALAGHPAYLT